MRPCIPPPPPPRDTLPCPTLPDDIDGEPADSGVHVIDPDRAATMRAEWDLWASETAHAPTVYALEHLLDGEVTL